MCRTIVTLGLALLLAPSLAFATEEFPGVIEGEVGTAGPPPCSVCHTGGVTALFTVTTPFGRALRARGLVAEDRLSLERALQALRDEGVDSDHDDVGDIAELEGGTDPNQPDGQPGQDVVYGCTGQVVTGRPSLAPPVVLGAALLVLFVSQRRRSRRSA